MKDYMCADCGHKQGSMDRRCDECKSVRVVLSDMTERLMQEADLTWDDCFGPKKVRI